MAEGRDYQPVFSERVADFFLQQPKRRQSRIVNLAKQLAKQPFVRSDYTLPDDEGRPLEHLLVEDYVFTYWIDHGAREIRIVDLDDAS